MPDQNQGREGRAGGKSAAVRILLVEDSPTQAAQLRMILESEGFQVEVAPDGARAFQALRTSAFDLVISGIVMPGISGYELCRQIKDDPTGRNLPVIILTALNDPLAIVEALECGADNFLTKPSEADYLLEHIRAILDNRALGRAGQLKVGAEVVFRGKKLAVNPDREQILNLVLASFEEVIHSNWELRSSQAELRAANAKAGEYARQLEGQVRASEEKARRLMEQANDAIFLLDPSGRVLEVNRQGEEVLGRANSEIIGCPVKDFVPGVEFDQERKKFQRLPANGSVRLDNLPLKREDGRPAWVDFSASVVEVRGGSAVLAILHDVTERRRAEQRLAAQHATTRILAESITLGEATPKILQAVCESLEWDAGEFWRVDRQANVLRFIEMWHSPSVGVEDLEAVSRRTTFSQGMGLPGRIWASGEPAWVPDVARDGNFPRASAAARAGLHAACGFPIGLGKEVLGTIAFFSRHIQQPDEHLLAMLAAMGSQVGQFFLGPRLGDVAHDN